MRKLKWLRQALLGGAALSVVATGAQADELAVLKAQLEALQSRVNQLETAPAPALPAGTRLLTVRRGQGTYASNAMMRPSDQLMENQGYTIAITPTADMPAPVSEVTVSGEIRARLLFDDVEIHGNTGAFIDVNHDDVRDPEEKVGFDDNDFDITTRARLNVQGRTETAIGEVGGRIRLQGVDGGDVTLNIGWGYWQMTPNFQLGGGYWDSLAAVQAGWDWNGETALVGLDSGLTNQSVSQFRLTYSSGPLTVAASLEDNDEGDTPAVAGAIVYDSGSFLLTASAIWEAEDDSTGFVDTDDNWFVGAGAIVRLSDMFRLEGAAGMGEGYEHAINLGEVTGENDLEFWGANVLAVVSFAEAMRVELGFAYSKGDHEGDELTNEDDAVETSWTAGASLFWDPVDQLTLGWGVGFTRKESDDEDARYDSLNAGFGAWFRF
jgi:hypothetical protein